MSDADVTRKMESFRTKVFYGIGSTAFGIKDNGFQTILLPFYQLVLHIPSQLVGLAIAIAFIFDAFLDPIVGQFSDNLHSRWGRRHPLMYAAALPVALSYLLLWHPPHWSVMATFYYLIVVAIVVRTFITFFEIPNSALVAELTSDYDQRTSFLSYRILFAWFGGLGMQVLALVVFLTPTATQPHGQLNEAGYGRYGLTSAIVMFAVILISSYGTQRFIPWLRKPPVRKLTLLQYAREMLSTLNNRAFLILMVAIVVFNFATGLVFALNYYIVSFYWLLSTQQIGAMAAAGIPTVIFSFLIGPPVSRAFGKLNGALLLFLVGFVIANVPIVFGLLGIFFHAGMPNLMWILMGFAVVSGSLTIGASILVTAMITDVVEDSELKTGRRNEGLFFAGNSFLAKAVTGLGVFGSGMLLWFADFPTAAVPGKVDPAIVHHFALVYLLVVCALYLTGVAIITRFPITRATHNENLKRLAGEVAEANEPVAVAIERGDDHP
ncbi:MAG TPA: MFS transporter [Rhizomicrobium sp.]|jgi:Na+/melibiose symporter-like transporter